MFLGISKLSPIPLAKGKMILCELYNNDLFCDILLSRVVFVSQILRRNPYQLFTYSNKTSFVKLHMKHFI